MSLPAAFLDRPLAHRGLHDAAAGRIENGRRAFRAAIAAGYGIELDVQLSADGVAMVFHDDRLDRLTAHEGPVRERGAAWLETVTLGHGDRIERLHTMLDDIAGRVPVLVEMKDPTGALAPTDGRLEGAVAGALATYRGPAAVMSFNPHMIDTLRRRAPDVIRGLATCDFDARDWPLSVAERARLREIVEYDRLGVTFVSHDHRDLDAPRIDELKRRGATVLGWTIRSPGEEAAARRVAHNITFEGYRPA